ncbi:MAG: hypothetical protein ACLGIE_09095 [Alphaproteobacteria bacterium]
MSVHSLPRAAAAIAVPDQYFQAARPVAVPVLRPLSALDQMYAYWGSDRA